MKETVLVDELGRVELSKDLMNSIGIKEKDVLKINYTNTGYSLRKPNKLCCICKTKLYSSRNEACYECFDTLIKYHNKTVGQIPENFQQTITGR